MQNVWDKEVSRQRSSQNTKGWDRKAKKDLKGYGVARWQSHELGKGRRISASRLISQLCVLIWDLRVSEPWFLSLEVLGD